MIILTARQLSSIRPDDVAGRSLFEHSATIDDAVGGKAMRRIVEQTFFL
jgi:hypothetical protein